MTGLQEMILIDEVILQSKIAQRAAARLKATHDNFDHVETWCSIQSILVAVGNISKILWPIEKYKARGNKLRQLLKVDNNNPISSRKFRNHFVHYDERIEEWFETTPKGVYIDLVMNPSLRNSIFNGSILNTNRGYNSSNNSLIFRDEILYLDDVFIALQNIVINCKSY
ncbi:hypothetical protein [Sphingobacterium sp. IITKGP-BTPF85]|uniref:hypothetical protein n=1 Tax=Sphingobacterium sp. IITKGP-BTPF85 TaxID=1338009 RepID=UPI000389F97F|nr:hypothetical protein [Sphingobacterium sp. IITKGP-BTPF85]KKX46446.1 hypothetical protein L950_0231925 [Sphingobacterium sp. IITKGP-BTPF85]